MTARHGDASQEKAHPCAEQANEPDETQDRDNDGHAAGELPGTLWARNLRRRSTEAMTAMTATLTDVRITSHTPNVWMYVFVGGTSQPEGVGRARAATCTKKADTNCATAKSAAKIGRAAVARSNRFITTIVTASCRKRGAWCRA